MCVCVSLWMSSSYVMAWKRKESEDSLQGVSSLVLPCRYRGSHSKELINQAWWSQHWGGRGIRSLWFLGQPDLQSEVQNSQGYVERPFFKTKNKTWEKEKIISKEICLYSWERVACVPDWSLTSYITKADFKLLTLLPLPPDCWDVPPYLASHVFLWQRISRWFYSHRLFLVYCALKIGKCRNNSISCKEQFYISCSLNLIFSL